MPKIDIKKLPKEITDKYSIVNDTFRLDKIKNPELDKYKNEPKDEIRVTLGSADLQEFTPDIELKRWNEVSFKLKPKGLESVATKDKTLSFEGEKIKFNTPKISFEMYDYAEGEGGFKYVWYLNEKPTNNKIEFDIETSGLDFFYQPPLTQQEIDEGAFRPPEVIGSYAVYHQTKGGMNDINGKDYKVGKAFHIYRPRIIDAEGKETWGILHIENGIYSVEIPQEFLDTAVYPIKSNDTFGYTSIGAGDATIAINTPSSIRIGHGYTPDNAGTLDSLHAALRADTATETMAVEMSIYVENTATDSHTRLKQIENAGSSITTSFAWNNFIANSESLNVVGYIISILGNGAEIVSSTFVYVAYDAGGSSTNLYSEQYTGEAPYATAKAENPWTETDSPTTNIRSVYATYTPSGSTVGPFPTHKNT